MHKLFTRNKYSMGLGKSGTGTGMGTGIFRVKAGQGREPGFSSRDRAQEWDLDVGQ